MATTTTRSASGLFRHALTASSGCHLAYEQRYPVTAGIRKRLRYLSTSSFDNTNNNNNNNNDSNNENNNSQCDNNTSVQLQRQNSRIALIMGVANQRSIAWSCVRRFLLDRPNNNNNNNNNNTHTNVPPWKVILTCQNDKLKTKVERMVIEHFQQQQQQKQEEGYGTRSPQEDVSAVIGTFSVDVSDPLSMRSFFHDELPTLLAAETNSSSSSSVPFRDSSPSSSPATIDAVVHSIAFAPNLKQHSLLDTTLDDFTIAHQISSYSLIDVTRNVLPYMTQNTTTSSSSSNSSITTLSYLGSDRAIPGYNIMGPAKASLESIVRGLALELGTSGQYQQQSADHDNSAATSSSVRVNAIRAGPISTLSSKGGISNFTGMLSDVERRSPLGRNVTSDEVAETLYHVAVDATGLTGQTINVDGGYSIVAGPARDNTDDD